MKIHIGQKIREAVRVSGMTVTEFAGKINCSRRNVYSIFEKTSIDLALLVKIRDILGYDFFSYYRIYPEGDLPPRQEAGRNTLSDENRSPEYFSGQIRLLREQIAALEREVSYLKEITAPLRERSPGKGKTGIRK